MVEQEDTNTTIKRIVKPTEDDYAMSNNIISSEIQNGVTCEAIGCYSKATNKVAVEVAPEGKLSFYFFATIVSRSFTIRDVDASERL